MTDLTSSSDTGPSADITPANPDPFAIRTPPIAPSTAPVDTVHPVFGFRRFGISSLMMGIAANVSAWTTTYSLVFLILAFILGSVSLRRKEQPRTFALAGLILGSVALILVLLILTLGAAFSRAAFPNMT